MVLAFWVEQLADFYKMDIFAWRRKEGLRNATTNRFEARYIYIEDFILNFKHKWKNKLKDDLGIDLESCEIRWLYTKEVFQGRYTEKEH